MTMGEKIKQLRSANGFTQEMLAKIIRIEKSLFGDLVNPNKLIL